MSTYEDQREVVLAQIEEDYGWAAFAAASNVHRKRCPRTQDGRYILSSIQGLGWHPDRPDRAPIAAPCREVRDALLHCQHDLSVEQMAAFTERHKP